MDTNINGDFCPLLQKACIRTQCKWYKQIMGKNPQTGEDINGWDCAVSWLPLLTVDVARHVNSAGAATESMRNEIVKRMDNPPQQLRLSDAT